MKKVIATLLALGMTTLLFAACGEDTTTTTTADPTTQTTVSTNDSTSATTDTTKPVETTTVKENIVFVDSEMVDNKDYGYFVRYIRNESNDIVGVAVHGWKIDNAATEIVVDSEYAVRNTTTGQLTMYPVLQVGVGQGVLSFQGKLESITIPSSVTKIATKAFVSCTKLKTLNLSEGLTSIGEMAFWNCTALETLVIPSTVTEIGRLAFDDCKNLKSVTLPRMFESQVENIFGIYAATINFTYVD